MNISSQSWTKWYFSMYNVHILLCLLKSSQIYDLLYIWHRYIFSPHIFFFFCQGRLRSLSHLEKISQLHEQNPLNSRLQATGQQPGEELLPEDEPAQPAEAGAQPFAPDEAVLSQLVDMGFSRNGCTRALYETKNSGVEAAMNWVMEHMGDANFNDPFVDPNAAKPKKSVVVPDEGDTFFFIYPLTLCFILLKFFKMAGKFLQNDEIMFSINVVQSFWNFLFKSIYRISLNNVLEH